MECFLQHSDILYVSFCAWSQDDRTPTRRLNMNMKYYQSQREGKVRRVETSSLSSKPLFESAQNYCTHIFVIQDRTPQWIAIKLNEELPTNIMFKIFFSPLTSLMNLILHNVSDTYILSWDTQGLSWIQKCLNPRHIYFLMLTNTCITKL